MTIICTNRQRYNFLDMSVQADPKQTKIKILYCDISYSNTIWTFYTSHKHDCQLYRDFSQYFLEKSKVSKPPFRFCFVFSVLTNQISRCVILVHIADSCAHFEVYNVQIVSELMSQNLLQNFEIRYWLIEILDTIRGYG